MRPKGLDNVTKLDSEECLIMNFGKSVVDCDKCYDLHDSSDWQLLGHALIVGAIIITTLVGNGLFFILLLKYKKLRRWTSMISVSVILANTGLVLSFHFPIIIGTVLKGWVFKFVGCQIFGFLSTQFIFTRWLNMGVLAFDRFCAVRFPFSYPNYSKYVLGILLSFSWVIPVLVSFSLLDGYAAVVFRETLPSCLLYAPGFGRGVLLFSLAFSLSFLVGGTLPVVMYGWLFYKAFNLRRSMLTVGRTTTNNSTNRILNSQGIQEKFFSEQKAIFTFALIFLAFCLTGMPIYTFEMLRWIHIESWCRIPHTVHFLVIEWFLLATAIDPFAVMREKDFRKRIKHLLCCHNNCGRYNANRSIISVLPPERDFDAIRNMAERALSLVSLSASRDSLDQMDFRGMPYRPRSGSAPATYRRPLTAVKIFDAVEEEDDLPYKERTRVRSGSASLLRDRNEVGLMMDKDFKTKSIYADINSRDCAEVSISFSD